MQKVAKRDFTTAWWTRIIGRETETQRSSVHQSLFIKRGLHSSGYPVETRICNARLVARADVDGGAIHEEVFGT